MNLFESIKLGTATAPNRVMFGPHETNLSQGRALSARHVGYYERRAQGGVGIVVVEEAAVHPSDWPYERSPLWTQCQQGWRDISVACHAHGSVVIAALGHSGGQGSSAYSQRELWGPSRVPEVNSREVPKWMEPEDIEAVITGFVDASAAAVEAGCDGVELNVGQHSLLRQFCSGLTNHRQDVYPAGPALVAEVLQRVRSAVGDAVIGVRFCADELAPWAGITPESAVELAAEFAATADYLVVTRGSIYSVSSTRPDTHVEPGFNNELAAQVRSLLIEHGNTDCPVFVQGSVVDLDMARDLIEQNQVDGVEMTRAHIADAELVAKSQLGLSPRPCILCNQRCQVRDARNPVVTCVVDPLSGYETIDRTPQVGPALEIAIVGGGPAGLEAARVAAERGHKVVLFEQRDGLGGEVVPASLANGRAQLGHLVGWLTAEVERLGVDVRLNQAVTPDELPDADGVVIAVGAIPRDLPDRVLSCSDAVRRRDELVGNVMIWDPIGGPVAVSVAETLAARGASVTFATVDAVVGNELARSGDLAPANARLQQLGVAIVRRHRLVSYDASDRPIRVELEHRFTGDSTEIQPDWLVLGDWPATPVEWSQEHAPGGRPIVARVGDCVAPRTIFEAILEARRAVLAIEGNGRLSDGVPMGLT